MRGTGHCPPRARVFEGGSLTWGFLDGVGAERVVTCSLENMVVACVGVLNDKNGTNQTRMHKWMEAKLVRACVARGFVQELD